MRSVFATVALSLLLLLILDESLPPQLVTSANAFPAAVTSTTPMTSNVANDRGNASNLNNNQSLVSSPESVIIAGEVTEYPVFISVTEETQNAPETAESEVVTEAYMIVEDQEIEEDDSDSSTLTPVVRSTTPMPSPKSSPQQEEVLRELKKLWDLSEGMSDTENDVLKSSLSSIVHLAYARVYIEPDETLMKLKHLLQQLQARILLGKDSHADGDATFSTKEAIIPSTTTVLLAAHTAAANYSTTTESPTNVVMTATTFNSVASEMQIESKMRQKRSYYEGNDNNVDAIFFANVNSGENSLLSEEQNDYKKVDKLQPHINEQRDNIKLNLTVEKGITDGITTSKLNSTDKLSEPAGDEDHIGLSIETASSTSAVSTSTISPLLLADQKVVRINDRKKPMPSFYLTPERIKELKSRVTSPSATTPSTTIKTLEAEIKAKEITLSPVSIIIDDEVENEVNLLQQQHHVENYDIHISSPDIAVVPLTTAHPPYSSSHKTPLFGESAMTINLSPVSPTETPFTAEDIALALFQLLRPDTFEDEEESEDEHVTSQPHPTPSSILYQVGSLSSVLNFTISSTNASASTMTTTTTAVPSKITTKVPLPSTMAPSNTVSTTLSFLQLKEKYMTKNKNNASLHEHPPSALSDLGFTSTTSRTTTADTTSTERQIISQNNDVYDSTDVLDMTMAADHSKPSITTSIVQGTQESIQQVVGAVTRLSIGAKMVLLFSLSISILSIGIGIYALGPPLAGVGVLGIIIPVALLLLFETGGSGGKKLVTRRQQLMNKLQSDEFSKVLDLIFEAATKYSSG